MVGVFSFLLLVSIAVFALAIVLLIIRAIKKQSKRATTIMATASVLVFVVSVIGIEMTYHPTSYQLAEQERIAAETAEQEQKKEAGAQQGPDTQLVSTAPVQADSQLSGLQTPDTSGDKTSAPPDFDEESTQSASTASTQPDSQPAVSQMPDTSRDESLVPADFDGENTQFVSASRYDALQQLYIDISPEMTYTEMLDLVKATELPYSEEKYNGSRVVQVAFTEDGTEEDGNYLEIHYDYAKNENSINDELEKYHFATSVYRPSSGRRSLICHNSGYYFSIYEPGNYIQGSSFDSDQKVSLTREEQIRIFGY